MHLWNCLRFVLIISDRYNYFNDFNFSSFYCPTQSKCPSIVPLNPSVFLSSKVLIIFIGVNLLSFPIVFFNCLFQFFVPIVLSINSTPIIRFPRLNTAEADSISWRELEKPFFLSSNYAQISKEKKRKQNKTCLIFRLMRILANENDAYRILCI